MITDGLQLLDVMFEPQLLADNRWGRLFALAYTNPKQVAVGLADGAKTEHDASECNYFRCALSRKVGFGGHSVAGGGRGAA